MRVSKKGKGGKERITTTCTSNIFSSSRINLIVFPRSSSILRSPTKC